MDRINALSLETELARIGAEELKGNKSKLSLLAGRLWSGALSGDRDCLRLLVDRLPPESFSTTKDGSFCCPRCHWPQQVQGDPNEVLCNVLQALVSAGVIRAELFADYFETDSRLLEIDIESPQ